MRVNNDSLYYDLSKEVKEKNKVENELDKDAFLHLLTTQMANQDPLSPMDDREFIAQLAQFSSLEQMNNLNDKMGEMVEAVKMLNWNQVEADVSLYKLVKEIADHLGLAVEEAEEGSDIKPGDNNENMEDLDKKLLAYRLMK